MAEFIDGFDLDDVPDMVEIAIKAMADEMGIVVSGTNIFEDEYESSGGGLVVRATYEYVMTTGKYPLSLAVYGEWRESDPNNVYLQTSMYAGSRVVDVGAFSIGGTFSLLNDTIVETNLNA